MIIFNAVYWLSRNVLGGVMLIRVMYGCDIPRRADISELVEFPHHALGAVIAPNAVIKKNVTIQHHVTIGMNGEGKAPIIHEGACIGAGALILGDVEIGENAIVGAETIVTKSVKANGTYINPTEIIDIRKGSLDENISNT